MILNKLIKGMDSLINEVNSKLYRNLEDYSIVDSISDNTTFLAEDGSLATILNIKGINKTIISDELMYENIDRLYKEIKSFYNKKGHVLQFYFCRDPEITESMLNNHFEKARKTAKDMHLDLDFYFNEKIKKLKNFIIEEECYIVLWSRPALLKNKKNDDNEISKNYSKEPLFEKSQNTIKNYNNLQNIHNAYCESIKKSLKIIGITADFVSVKKATNIVKSSTLRGAVGNDWSARMYNDSLKSKTKNKPVIKEVLDSQISPNDLSYYLYPKLKNQLLPSGIERVDSEKIKLNNLYYSSLYMSVSQEEPKKFSDLLSSIPDDISFQISYKIEGDGLKGTGLKKILSTFLAFDKTSNNKLIKESLKYYNEQKREGRVFTKNSITVNVWAEEEKELNKRIAVLQTELQNWGSTSFKVSNSDNYETFFNTLPLYNPTIPINTNVILPLDEMLFMLPINRPINLIENGLITYRTEDKKLISYDAMTKYLNYFNELIFATPGSGKSVKSNNNNLAFLLRNKTSKKLKNLIPLLFIIDIGPSSKGLIEFLRSVSPKDMKDRFIYKKIENTKENSVNILDTPLGCRMPPQRMKSLMVSFITLLTSPAEGKKIDSDMVSLLLDKTYKEFAKRSARDYRKNMLPEVDSFLKKTNFETNAKTKWWDITDYLFKKGKKELAKRAQIEAMPTLIEMVNVLNSDEELKGTYSKVTYEGSENMVEAFGRLLGTSLNSYPIFAGRTVLNFPNARVLSFDLNDVAPNPEGDLVNAKQSGLMFNFSTIYGLKDFFYEETTYKYAPSFYKEYLMEEYKVNKNIPKRFVVDEFHRGAAVKRFKNEVVKLLRESRKWNMSNCLISQLFDDFKGDVKNLCNAKFVLSAGDEKADEIASNFKVSNDIREILRSKLTGGSSLGLPFVLDIETNVGKFSQYLYSTLSGVELWATTTTREDADFFAELSEYIPVDKLLSALAKEFPSGGIKDLLEESEEEELYDKLVEKIKNKYI
tara:strand:+ start:3788 stop:6757 length:2970 start_codon:yes stop_codon:yes gene_type:complete